MDDVRGLDIDADATTSRDTDRRRETSCSNSWVGTVNMLAERGGTSGLLQFAILNIIISNPGNVFCALEISGSGRIKSCLDQSATADQSGQNVAENSEVVLEHCNREVAMHIEIKNSGTVRGNVFV